MTEPIQSFSIARGTDNTVSVSVATTIANDTLVGCTIKFGLYSQQYGIVQSDTPLLLKQSPEDITIPLSPLNLMEFDVIFRQADTADLDYGNYYYEATVYDEIGDKVCVISGPLAITVTENQ